MWVKKMALCEVCGKEYLKTTPTRKYCSDECSKLMERRLHQESRIAKKASYKEKIAQERRYDLNRILREAAAHGMSYGKYVAYLERKGESM